MTTEKRPLRSNGMALSLAILLSLTAGSPALGDSAAQIPETINLNTQVNHPEIAKLPKDKKEVNSFSHAKHAQSYIKGKSEFSAHPFTDEFTCAACHLGSTSEEEISGTPAGKRLGTALSENGGAGKLKNYFHGICKKCHKNMKKAKEPTGPTMCKGCHARK